jgi:hypothetical protein
MKGKGRSGYQPGSGELPGIGLTVHLLRDVLREQICAREDVKAALARGQCVKIHYETGRFEIIDLAVAEPMSLFGWTAAPGMASPVGTYEIIKPPPSKNAGPFVGSTDMVRPGVVARRGVVDHHTVLRQSPGVVDASNLPGYTGDTMGDAAHDLNALAADLDLPFDIATEALKQAKAELTARENPARATATPRLKWETDRQADENPAHFAARADYEHRGQIHEQDRPLSVKLSNWLRTHDWPEDVRYIPTKPEWNDRQVENLPQLRDDTVREVERLAAAARYRAAPRRHP